MADDMIWAVISNIICIEEGALQAFMFGVDSQPMLGRIPPLALALRVKSTITHHPPSRKLSRAPPYAAHVSMLISGHIHYSQVSTSPHLIHLLSQAQTQRTHAVPTGTLRDKSGFERPCLKSPNSKEARPLSLTIRLKFLGGGGSGVEPQTFFSL